MRVKYSREAASLKMVKFNLEEKIKMQSKSKISARWHCKAVLTSACLWTKYLIIEMAKLPMLYKRQVCTTIHIQQGDDMAFNKQQEDNMDIYRWQLHQMVSSSLLNIIVLYRQSVVYLAVFLAINLALDFIYNHHHEASNTLVFSLTEYRHFQGSWSVPRRSGSQVTRFWLMMASSKLGQMQDKLKMAKCEQKFVENKLKEM